MRMIKTAVLSAGVIAVFVGPGAAQETWRHAMVQAKGDAGFFYMAEAKNFFEELGLDVEIIEMKGSKHVLRALLAGEADSADANPSDVLVALDVGADLRFVGSSIIGYPYAMYTSKEIDDWSELQGKTFGVSSPGSAPHMFALAMMEEAGVPTEDMKIANAGGSAGRLKALAAGQIDAAASSSEFIPLAEEYGVKVLGHAKDMAPKFPRFTVVVSGDTLEERPEDTAKFLAGYLKGLRYAADHRDETIALAAEINGDSPESPRFAYAFDEIVDGGLIDLEMGIPREKISWMQDMMLRMNKLDEPIDIEAHIADEPRERALELLAENGG